MASTRQLSKHPSMRKTWFLSIAITGVLLALLGAVSVLTSAYQRGLFERTTRDVARTTTAMVDLRLAINAVDDPAGGLMYALGGPAALPRHQSSYARARADVSASFDRLHDVAPAAAHAPLAAARQNWERFDSSVLAAPQLWARGGVATELAAGHDPFERAWGDRRTINKKLAVIERVNIAEFRQSAASAAKAQRVIPWALLGVLGLALVTGFLTARRMSRRILAPLAELGRVARALGNADFHHVIDVKGASAELQELARTIEETALSLRTSHVELRSQALTDELTGLPNRKAFVEELEKRFVTRDDGPLAVLFIDLDDFKVVNDSLGHAAGDALLGVVASRLLGASRASDFVARLGGDEFALLVDSDDTHAASVVAGHVLEAMEEPVTVHGVRMPVRCSIGVAVSSVGAETADELLRNADFAMYMAKGRGKSCVESFLPSMHMAMQTELEFKRELSLAAAKGQLVVHYQPILDLGTEQVLGMEALVRWNHPMRGLLGPQAFIPLAEETGDVVALGRWVLGQACADLAAQRLVHGDVWVSVNVSAQQLASPGFVDDVAEALSSNGLPARALLIEITEHVAVSNTQAATEVLAQLRTHGVRIALDDFGVGYSSLRYLRELPVDVLKIDQSFVVDTADRAVSMLNAIVSMAQQLDLDVIAEGIEEQVHLERLHGLGSIAGQGYLFARPMPFVDMTRTLGTDPRGAAELEPPRAAQPAAIPAPRSIASPVVSDC